MEIVSKAFEKAFDIVVEVAIRQLAYIAFYKRNVNELRDCVEELERAKDRVRHQVEEAENNGKVIEADVTHWLAEVDKKITENETFHKDKGHSKTDCSMGLLPYLCFRHQLGRKAKKMTLDVKPLLEKSKFDDVSIKKDSTSMDVALSNFDYESFKSRTEVMGRIKVALEDSNVRMIGVFGPGGVGKTTLVKEVAKKAKEDNLFNMVVMVNVTRDPNLTKIQKEIADMLGLRLEEESEIARADRLRKRLKKEKENILIIIDDLWEGLDFNKLGISFDEDDFCHMAVKDTPNSDSTGMKEEKSSSSYKECKILLTSRSREVLSTQMDVKTESIFSVGLLEENEAKTLFKKLVAKIPEKNFEFEKLVDEIMEKCAGLPMAIIAVGKALRNKSCSEWKEAIEQLNRQGFTGMHKSMEFSIKLSYDHLESEELKLTFLLCAQMGPHPLVMDLVKHCVGLGILEGVHTIREARNRIDRLIQKFKDVGLLLASDSSDYFNMHDTVRDAALSIASKERNIFTLRNGKLDEWLDKDELKRCTSIYLYNCDIIDGLPESINCPQLKVFHIDNVDPSMRIPDNFFKGMRKLRVLILNGIHIPHFPSSIKYLNNLRMLCLERCVLGDSLFKIGELKKLRIMSFSGSKIEKLPGEIKQLVNLQWLDISNCSKLRVIPPNVLSSLTSLEELYLRNSLIQREVEGETGQSLIVVLNELSYLHKLETLDICISNVAVMPKNLFFDKLDNYKIMIGDFKSLSVGDFKMPDKYETSRALALQIKEGNDIHSQKGIKILFKRVENLLLGELKGVCDALYELNLEGFSCLKHFSIYKNSNIQYIIKSMEIAHPHNVFPELESLCLYKLDNMEILFNNRLTDDSLRNLKTIKIQTCSRLKFLFSFELVRLLTNLETIEVFKCNSLEEIVTKEIQEITDTSAKDDKIEFPQLCSLALRTLPNFTGFYAKDETISISQSMEGQVPTKELDEITKEEKHAISVFSDRVFIPNIESLELSSLNIHKIWGYQASSSLCFQKLTKLNVNQCNRLTYLFSFSMAKNLENLKDLSVSYCEMMEDIFYPKKVSTNEAKAVIFPKLENIGLTSLKKLSTIWQSQVCSEGSFRNLNSVVIEYCHQLETVFPSHMIGILKNLVSLRVHRCDSVKAIFNLEHTLQTNADGDETKLQRIFLMFLPSLNLAWSRDPKGILNFKNLQAIKVYRCSALQHILPLSVAKDVQKLESLEASYCGELEEIVASTEEGSETRSNTLMFPQVTKLILEALPKLRRHNLEWKALKHMVVRDCEKLEAFTTDTKKFQRVIPNLEYMAIGLKEAECLRRCIGNCLMHNLKHLAFYSLNSSDIVYWFLHRIPNLEYLRLLHCRFEELLPCGSLAAQEKIGTVVRLKDLRLINLGDLQNIGLERDPVLQRVESLTLRSCPQLIKLASSSVFFTHLTYLEVSWCGRLMNLVGSATAKSLVQLTTMKVMYCEAMEEIVAKEENEEENVVKIVFSKLITLELVELKNLSSFCSSKKLAFYFPSLENLIVRECYKMKIFTKGVTSAPNLQKVKVEVDQDGDWYWEGGLNSTIRNLGWNLVERFARNVRYLDFVDHPELEKIWHGVVLIPDKSFSNLRTFVVDGCDFLSHVIPSHLVPFLSKLEELRVENCDSVKVIFDVKNTGAFPLHLTLKNLNLKELPNLEDVWNKDPQGIVKLQTLEEVHVDGCKGLKSLFPASVAKDLVKLETLNVKNCEELVEIVAIDETAEEEAGAQRFVLPCVASLKLQELPELKCFYLGPHELEWPALKKLHVYHCDKLKIFTSEFQNCRESLPENQLETSFAQQALFSVEKVFPNLNNLSLNGKDTMMLWHEAFPENLLHNLKFLWLICFHNVGKADRWLSELLHKVPNIKKLRVCCSGFEEIFPSQTLDVECTRVLAQLKKLHLERLSRLKSIGLEHPWLHPLLQTLENLKVARCPRLTKLVQSTVFFSNLKQLVIFECHGLEYLFTTLTARNLVRLEQMEIVKCKSIKEIVAKEGDESVEDEIIFEQLKQLSLRLLPSLVSFYNGNSTLIFRSLESVAIVQCPKMKIFSQGVINAPRLKYGQCRKSGFDITIEELFNEQVPYQYSEDLKLSEYPELERVWHGELALPENCFRNLKSLVMENLKFISKAVPSHLLPYLKSLKELQVRSCTSVEVIFDIKGEKTTFCLEKLTLDQLPNMKHMWDKDPQGVLRFESLQDVHVTNCEGLKALFPESMAKNLVQLKKLRIARCKALEEIVGKEEVAADGTSARFLFPRLTSVTLTLLPELKCFYNEKHNLQCPILQDLRVCHCCKLKIFATDPQSYQEAHAEDHVGISFLKVIPKVEELSLNEEETMKFWHGDYAANLLNRLIRVQLSCFHNVKEVETLPWGFLQKVPKIESLAVACSDFEELFPSQGVDVDVNVVRIFAQLNGLRVENLSKLNSIGLEQLWLNTLRENLKILEVSRCPCLTKLVQSPVSFSNLRELFLNKCDGLIYLFTSSTAKSLVSLKRMSVDECESLKEIVATEGDESSQDDLIFEKLRKLSLNSLPCLASFYEGCSVLKFPSLGEVIIAQCPTMKFFSQGLVITPILIEIQASMNEDDIHWEGDLNTTIEKMFKEKAEQDNNDAIIERRGEKDR